MSIRLRIDLKQNELGLIIVRGLAIEVRVLETRTVRGKTRYLVTPERGSGQLWVELVYPLTKVS